MNHAVFFPLQKFIILTIFMAWINLDLGIQNCFYNGMDAYAMTWLQFSFPLYIWTIMIFVIALSWRYHIAARVIGKNAVKILTTLLLLSYTKSYVHHNSVLLHRYHLSISMQLIRVSTILHSIKYFWKIWLCSQVSPPSCWMLHQ